MTKTRRAGFRKKRRRGGRKTVKRRGGGKTIKRKGGRKTIKRRGGTTHHTPSKGGEAPYGYGEIDGKLIRFRNRALDYRNAKAAQEEKRVGPAESANYQKELKKAINALWPSRSLA